MKVLKVESKQIRNNIEQITMEDIYTGTIQFQKDINGDWVVDKGVLDDPNFIEVKQLLLDNSIEIDFVGLPLPDDLK